MKKQVKMSTVVALLTFLVFIGYAGEALTASSKELPKAFVWTSLKLGSAGHSVSVALGEAIRKNIGVPVRVIPDPTDLGGWLPILTGKGQASFRATSASYPYSAGIGPVFGKPEWGPQRVRMIWQMPLLVSFATTKDTGVKTWYDLKGKRLPDYSGWCSGRIELLGLMAGFNIRPEDITWVPTTGYMDGIRALMEGRIDMASVSPFTKAGYELDAKKGLFYPEDAKDPESIDRWLEIAPFFIPMWWAIKGPGGLSPDRPIWKAGMRYMVLTHDKLDAESAYLMTKGIWEGYEIYKDMHPYCKYATHEEMLNFRASFDPYHEGTVRFLKEIGVWTKEHEGYQQEVLALEEKRIAAWEEAAEAAKAKGIKLSDQEWWGEEKGFAVEYLRAKKLISIPKVRFQK